MHFGVRIDFSCLRDAMPDCCLGDLQLHGEVIGPQMVWAPTLFLLQLLDDNLIVSLPDVLILVLQIALTEEVFTPVGCYTLIKTDKAGKRVATHTSLCDTCLG